MANREAFIKTAIKYLSQIDPGNQSVPIIEKSLREMSKSQFEAYIEMLRNGVSETPDLDKPREILPIVLRDSRTSKITIKGNFDLAKRWGHNFFERVWMIDQTSGMRYMTNVPYTIMHLPIVRQAQTLEKKIAVADSTTKLDSRTGQTSDATKGASLSSPELQTLLSQGRTAVAMELMKFRGGDDRAYRRMSKDLADSGTFYQSAYNEPTRAKSADVASIYLKAMHLDNDL